MKTSERLQYLKQGPKIAWDAMTRGEYRFQYDLMPVVVRDMSAAQRINLLRAGARPGAPAPETLELAAPHAGGIDELLRARVSRLPYRYGRAETLGEGDRGALVEQLFSEVGRYLLTVSLWGWGEPLLHKQLAQILKIAERYPMASLLSTNGHRLARSGCRARSERIRRPI